MLVLVLAAVVTLGPVSPAVAKEPSAAEAVTLYVLVEGPGSSNRSIIPAGGVALVSVAIAANVTNIRSGPVVVTDGAVTAVAAAFACPADASTGLAGSTPT